MATASATSNRFPAAASTLLAVALRFPAILIGVGVLSGVLNLLFLSGSIFMLEIYDRVLPSRSIPTLVGLAALLAVLYGFQALLDALRARILVRTGTAAYAALSDRLFAASLQLPLRDATRRPPQPLADLEQVRRFLSGGGPATLFDLPWIPVYLAVCFAFHPAIGWTALAGALLLFALAAASERVTETSTRSAYGLMLERDGLAEAARRNAVVVAAMGLSDNLAARWHAANAPTLRALERTADVIAGMSSLSRVIRLALQSLVLAVGAVLVIGGEATGGIMIASSILAARALAPIEQAIAHWRSLAAARQAWQRLEPILQERDDRFDRLPLAPPSKTLSVEMASAAAPGSNRVLIRDIDFRLVAGDCLGIVGQSGSGKSTLTRVMVGVWPTAGGHVRLDGAALDQWHPTRLGRHIGYLPQDVELFAGTVAQNISRFEPDTEAEAIIRAAEAADVHDLILQLPDGYDTELGDGGMVLSAGQQQRIALARALFGDPFLVVLDEPNSNLDADGDVALARAIEGVRRRNGIVAIVAHRPSALSAANVLLVMAAGRMLACGPKDEVVAKIARQRSLPSGAAAAAVSASIAEQRKVVPSS